MYGPFWKLVVLSQVYVAARGDSNYPRSAYLSEMKETCSVYEEAIPNLLDDILRLSKDTFQYIFVVWPELKASPGFERIVDRHTLSDGSMALEKSILRVQALVVKDVGKILDEVAQAIDLTRLLNTLKSTGHKFHIF